MIVEKERCHDMSVTDPLSLKSFGSHVAALYRICVNSLSRLVVSAGSPARESNFVGTGESMTKLPWKSLNGVSKRQEAKRALDMLTRLS